MFSNLKLINEEGEVKNIAIISGIIAISSFYIYLLSYSFFQGYYLEMQDELLTYSILSPVPYNYRALLFFGIVLLFSLAAFGIIIWKWYKYDVEVDKRRKMIQQILALFVMSLYFGIVLINFNSGIWLDVKVIKVAFEIMMVVLFFIIIFRKDIIVLGASISLYMIIEIILIILSKLPWFSFDILSSDFYSAYLILGICTVYVFPKCKGYVITIVVSLLLYTIVVIKVFDEYNIKLDRWYLQLAFISSYIIMYILGMYLFKWLLKLLLKLISEKKFYTKMVLKLDGFILNLKEFLFEMLECHKHEFLIVAFLAIALCTVQIMNYLGKESNDILPDESYSQIVTQDGVMISGIPLGNDGNMYYIATDEKKLLIFDINDIKQIKTLE